ncbi:hypothetical protein EDD98_7721 [Streptomyces sp. PanSC19]|uniref:hypothetical protein n=1 Tax=Streptomyces sp. PanSC19 TaxID=1520455 RepID=UPI000F483AD7|nr:hypothetical protein [Streptomyces sp. PanSC19]ROQ22694.1 hypothetical protein EDD98_7721 [Streptomyces sp. PanSC19]
MSTDLALAQAVTDARQAEAQAAQIAQILAVVQAAQAVAPTGHGACSCSTHTAPRRSAGTTAAWLAGGAACACVLIGLFLAVALVAVAVTVGGCVSYLLIRQIRTDRKGK